MNKRKIASLVLACAMVLGILAGCGGGGFSTGNAGSSGAATGGEETTILFGMPVLMSQKTTTL